jgi:hypothetical protein
VLQIREQGVFLPLDEPPVFSGKPRIFLRPHVLLVEQPHQPEILRRLPHRLVVQPWPGKSRQPALPPNAQLMLAIDPFPPLS